MTKLQQTTQEEVTHYDTPDTVKDLIALAVKLNVIDILDVYIFTTLRREEVIMFYGEWSFCVKLHEYSASWKLFCGPF